MMHSLISEKQMKVVVIGVYTEYCFVVHLRKSQIYVL